MINFRKPANLLLSVTLILVLFGLGFNVGRHYNNNKFEQKVDSFHSILKSGTKKANLDFSLFWNVWDELDQKFVSKDKLDPTAMYYGAIKGMVGALDDPYTFFLTPEENKQSKDDLGGLFEGIGAQLGLKEGRIIVVAPIKSSPAERAGIRSGDIILKVNNVSTLDWPLQKAVTKIRGPKGTKVAITIFREGVEKTYTITREAIKISSVELDHKGTVAVLKLNRFGDDTNDEWDRQIDVIAQELANGTINSMVLDVRDNPGGFLQSAIYISGEFLPRGAVVVKQEYKDKRKGQTFIVERNGRLLTIPLVVLINNGSASASEIVAGALRDHKRAKLIGVKSYGKGSIQEALDLKSGAGLHVTIARWVLPNGDWINGKGIVPDIKIESKKPDVKNTPTKDQDTQLDKAIETVLQSSSH